MDLLQNSPGVIEVVSVRGFDVADKSFSCLRCIITDYAKAVSSVNISSIDEEV